MDSKCTNIKTSIDSLLVELCNQLSHFSRTNDNDSFHNKLQRKAPLVGSGDIETGRKFFDREPTALKKDEVLNYFSDDQQENAQIYFQTGEDQSINISLKKVQTRPHIKENSQVENDTYDNSIVQARQKDRNPDLFEIPKKFENNDNNLMKKNYGGEIEDKIRNQNKDKSIKDKIQEYQEVNKDKFRNYKKDYQEANKDKFRNQLKAYREANKVKIKEYQEANKDKIRNQNKEYQEANKDKIRNITKEYLESNKDKIRNQLKAYREANMDKIKEYHEAKKDKIRNQNKDYWKNYKEANKVKIKEYQKAYNDKIRNKTKAYREANKDKIRNQNKAYREANKDKIKEYQQANKDKIKEYQQANKDKFKNQFKAYKEANKSNLQVQ